MRVLVYMLMFLSVMGMGFWAYTENYATQQVLKDVSRLNAEIGDLREALSIQRAEWAYLNRPDRLRDLATINFDRLGLLPLQPEQFGMSSQIVYPVPADPVVPMMIEGPVDVQGELPATDLAVSSAGAAATAAPGAKTEKPPVITAEAAPQPVVAEAAAPVAAAPAVAPKAPKARPKAKPAAPKAAAATLAPAKAPEKVVEKPAEKPAATKPVAAKPAAAPPAAPAKAPSARPPARKPQVKTP